MPLVSLQGHQTHSIRARQPPLYTRGAYSFAGQCQPGYRAKAKVMVKVLDFIKSGGPKRTALRTFRWEISI